MNKEAISAALLKTMPSGWAARYNQAGQAASAKRGLTWAGGGTARAALPSRSATQATAPAPAPAAPPAPVATPATAPVAVPAAMPGTPAPMPVANPALARVTGGWKPAPPPSAPVANPAVTRMSATWSPNQAQPYKAASLMLSFMDELDKTAEKKRRRSAAALGAQLGLLGVLGGVPLYRGIKGFGAVQRPSRMATLKQLIRGVKREGFPLTPLEARRTVVSEGATGKEMAQALRHTRKRYGQDLRSARLNQLKSKLEAGLSRAKSPYRLNELGGTMLSAILASVLAGSAGKVVDTIT